ncbi:MAG TPA: metal ABC transporter permease [Anaeromyxobacteraceae bacterium]|nr:metal ABC transporter permease [Anaeromyxobacteraceae bacterium]
MSDILRAVFEPGFFSSTTVRAALLVGGVVAIVAAAVGTFTVLREQAFAGHALGEVGTAGGSAAFLAGANPLWGFTGIAIVAAGIIEMLGARRPKARDLATGLVLGGALGFAALFLYLGTTSSSTTGASYTILFGSLFAISESMAPTITVLSVLCLGVIVLCYRMLLLTSLSPDLAGARGIPLRLVGAAYLLALALAVSLSAETIGAVLATALLIGPPATALRLTKRPGMALGVAALIGVAAAWLGILLAYDSYYWPPAGRGWPVSFFVVVLVFLFYLLSGLALRRAEGRGGAPAREQPADRVRGAGEA